MDTLGQISILFDGDFRPMDSAMDSALARAQAGGAKIAAAGVLAAVGSYQRLKGEISATLGTLNEVTGVGSAANYEMLNVAFTSLLKNGAKAKSLLDELYALGAKTPFNSDSLAGFARQLLANGFAAEGLAKKIGTIADAASALGLKTEGMGRLTYVLGQVRAGGIQGDDLRQFKNAGVNLAEVVGLAMGKQMQSAKDAMQALRTMSPERQVDTILRGLDARFSGMAEKIGSTTFAGLTQNLEEKLSMALRPTGELLLGGGLKQGVGVVGNLLGGFQKLNTATYGAVGLISVLAAGVPIVRGFIADLALARAALRNMAGQGAMVGRPITITGGPIYLSGAVVGGGAGGALVPVGGGAAGAAGVAATGIRAILPAIGAFLKNPFTIGGIAALAGGAMQTSGNGNVAAAGGVLQSVGNGAMIGSLIGSFIPGIGNVVGGLVGGAVGLLGDTVQRIYEKNNPPGATTDTASERTAKATEEAARSLKELRVELVGGGKRSQNAASRIELEYAMVSYQRAAFGAGIG
jgi:hypothetical protein